LNTLTIRAAAEQLFAWLSLVGIIM